MELQHGNRTAPGAVAKRIKNSSGGKSVVVLKKGDVTIRKKIVYMPNTIEMAQLKKLGRGQFRTQVPIDSGMTVEHIETLLKKFFPCLEGQRLYCAAAVNNRTELDFHGIPRIWDGSFIKRKIKGNSALYIFAEESGRPSIFDSHTCIPEQAAPIWSQGQFVSQGSGDLVQPIGMGSLEPEIQGPPITGLLSNYFVCHSSVAPAMTPEVNQAFLFLSETNSSPQDENPLNGGPNTGTHSTTSYLCPNNASQMFPTLSDSWHQELSELDSANVPSSDFDSGWQDDGNGLPCDRDSVSSDLDSMLPLFGDQNFTSSSMNIVDGQSSMEIQPEGTVHQDQVGADCNGNSPTEEFDSLTTATDLNIKSRNSSQECDLDHSVVQRIIPPSGSVEGGYPFVIALSEPLPGQVNFGEAKFHGVATVNLEKLNNHTFSGTVPRCHLAEGGIVKVTVMTETGQHLGTTSFEYVDELTKIAKEITVDHGKQAKFFSKLSEEHKVLSGSSLQSKQQHSLQFLQFLVYTASQTGAKKFIEIIFSTSAGQIVFDSYKDRTCLPDDVARASGHDELANYLQDLTTRFSKEPEFSRKEAHVIDWSELEAAATAAQNQGCLTEEKSSDDSSENNSDTDYFADVETSSIDSSELSRSTSEDDTSEPNSRDKTKASAHQSISSIGKWAFAGNGTMGKIGQIKEGMKQKSCVLILRDSHFDSSLPEVVKGLDYTLAFHLAIGSKNIPCHLHTVNERFLVLRESITRQPTMSFCKLHPYPDVLKESSLVKNNKGLISNTVASKQRHWNQLNEDIVPEFGTLMPIKKDIAVEWKSSGTFGKEFGAHTHCDLWVFRSAFRPTRKTFFVYFADRRNALPHSYFFEYEDCESQVQCWKWKRSGNNSLKFTESVKEKKLPPGREKSQMESDVDLPVTYIVRDKQAQTPSESGICLSWMHAMMHHFWTTESTEKASNIIIFDHFLGPLGTDLMMSSGSRNDDSNKKKLNICQPVVSSGVGNTKINHEKWGMVESVFIDQTDCKIKGNEAKETKVEADSSKTERRTDAGKSLPAFTVDDSERRLRSSLTRCLEMVKMLPKETHDELLRFSAMLKRIATYKLHEIEGKAPVSKAKTSKENFAKCTRDASFSGDLTDSTIEVNIGEETKVQADSSNTPRTVDARKSLPAFAIGNCKYRGSPASALRPLGTDLMMSSGSRNDDSNKKKLNICQPVVSSGVGNTKINHEKWGMVESVFIDQTDCKIKGNEAKETKVEADSSKTERRTDAGKSLPAFTVDDSEIRRPSSLTSPFRGTHERFRQACKMRLLVLAEGGRCFSYWTAAWEALPFLIGEYVTCLAVQEKGDGYAAPVNLVSSLGNAEKPTVHRCSTDEINQWKQQLSRSKPRSKPRTKPLKARQKKNARNPSFTLKITEVARHREHETPVFTDSVYNAHQEKLVGIRIYPKGVRNGTSTRVALFMHMIKGGFDNFLVWPFDGTITVSVLDQSDSCSRRDLSRIIEGNPVLPAFQQPDLSICRTGYGYERFAPIEEFFGPRYVKDDGLVLKIEFSREMIDTLERPLRTDFMMSLGSRNDNSNKGKLNMFQPVVSSFVGNTKINRENCGMVESVFIDQTDCKIKDNEAKETKVQADSSKTATRIDSGKSLPAFTVDNSQRTRRHASPIRPFTTALMMSGSRKDDRKKGKRNICQPVVSSFVGNAKINREKWGMVKSVFIGQTDCKIKGNEAKETKVQADSSKTATRIDAGKSLPAFTADTSERTRRLASPISNVVLRRELKTEALQYWEPKVAEVVQYVKERENRFSRMQIFRTGSYYERTKVDEPDEFDLMLVVENLELDDGPYGDDEDDGMSEPPKGFTRVMIDMGEERIWRQDRCVNARGMLSASSVKSVFARHVRNAIEYLGYGRFVEVRSQGPAVTLIITNRMNGRKYSIDLTLAIKDKWWPEDADEWKGRSRRGWPNQDLVREIWHDGCHLVAKQPKGSSVPDHEKGFLWRYSFSEAEKKLFLQGGHGEASSCRKQVLRILKALKEELDLRPLKSYHLKTMLLYECEANPHSSSWSFDLLGDRFMGLLQRLQDCLSHKNCPHYFMREFNLFETFSGQRCTELLTRIQRIEQDPVKNLHCIL
ncbi:uncharacterized protein [Montipora capricornis]|uniref:uncharacterized protein isoform X2 n=1 Tax=Montipora capricornis TaxID=246305 RepID=UPI0035F14196